MREAYPETPDLMKKYFKPIARWADAFQNDFAARADWCVTSYDEANHPPVVKLANSSDMVAKPGSIIKLSAQGTSDPDGDELSYFWWQYEEVDTYQGVVKIENSTGQEASITIPADAMKGQSIHIVCEVKDNGIPQLTRYKRVILEIEQ